MSSRHVVVDGSNIATEGRSMPSLAQLDQAVREFMVENPNGVVTVVVDASFGHRIDPSEVNMYEEADSAGELVSPPAGAIGRGDAFLLRIADKMGATVLSNDSFQEFHGAHPFGATRAGRRSRKPNLATRQSPPRLSQASTWLPSELEAEVRKRRQWSGLSRSRPRRPSSLRHPNAAATGPKAGYHRPTRSMSP